MATLSEDDEWDKDTDDIESIDSEELYEKRPNRWQGPPQTWRTLTEEDRLTYTALEGLRNNDLSVHLYNAFALKKQQATENDGAPAPEEVHILPPRSRTAATKNRHLPQEDINAETGLPVGKQSWAPPKAWAAWPLRAKFVPPDDFMKRTEDGDEVFTFRRVESQTPSSTLEEVISATVLRFAREKFRKRDFSGTSQDPEESMSDKETIMKPEPMSTDNESLDVKMESDVSAPDREARPRTKKVPEKTFKPTIAIDDDLSCELIRPSTRAILEKLDQTLTVLHNARMASVNKTVDSAESSSREREQHIEDSDEGGVPRASPQRRRSRSTTRVTGDEYTGTEMKKRGGGRKKIVHQPREGESQQEFLIRLARQQKKKKPVFDDDGNVTEATTTAGEESRSGRKRNRMARKRKLPSSRFPSRSQSRKRGSMTDESDFWSQSRLARQSLRDWSDVMGAAALAGFSPAVIARATQRCANLFGQGMDVYELTETVVGSGETGIQTTKYRPGEPLPSSSSEDEDGNEELELRQARSMSRHSSRAPSRMPSALSAEEDEPSQKPQKRSRSRGSAIGDHYCPDPDCPRAVKGFSKFFNLRRHKKEMHGLEDEEHVDDAEEEEGVNNGMDGAIHRDGFLQPIRMQKGWRSEDTKKRARKKSQKKREREAFYDSTTESVG